MSQDNPRTIYLKDYRVPAFLIDRTELHFELGEKATLVKSRLSMRRNPACEHQDAPLCLHGDDLQLRRLVLDGVTQTGDQYLHDKEGLTLHNVPVQFVVECVTLLKPQDNSSLEGLYRSNGMFCTQCEAEGFRKITFYLDRPDVMSVFTTTLVADRTRYPVLLSNGNLADQGELDDGRHWTTWEDPFPKPAYLFALIAGDLQRVEDRFTTRSGRDVALHLYVEAQNLHKCEHALDSLKRAMTWDEQNYGREYDLDLFMIVAVDHFNMGAMENKGLNIFNSSCVLANPDTTTDAAFQRIEGIVAHEYFHNWSGNRVTCRDWFQLSLKEGFTVFRDATFSADMGSATVKRIEDVNLLRTAQFAEDAGPMAHPVRPPSFIEISNFYTLTVYEKGAEVVRMLHTLLGAAAFRRGSDLYFDRFDGQAVTTDDFVACMEEVAGLDLTQFKRWYTQAGTPCIDAEDHYDAESGRYTLTLRQHCPATPGQANDKPFYIPVVFGLLDAEGNEIALPAGVDSTLTFSESEQCFVFDGLTEKPIPSLLRGFSAPVKLTFPYSRDELMFLMSHDSDGFNRWEAGQRLAVDILQELVKARAAGQALSLDGRLVEAFRHVLRDEQLDPAMVAKVVTLPSESYLSELSARIDVEGIHAAREFVRLELARQLYPEFLAAYQRNTRVEPYRFEAEALACRSLKNICLAYLLVSADPEGLSLVETQFYAADNMTDRQAALSALVNDGVQASAERALADFYQAWQHDALVVNQWFSVQACAPQAQTLDRVVQLMQHADFDLGNPNRVRALIGAFANQNAVQFHRPDGAGYRFLADRIIELNLRNPQIASRLLTPLTRWRKYDAERQRLMRAELERIQRQDSLSKDVFEVVSKSLADL